MNITVSVQAIGKPLSFKSADFRSLNDDSLVTIRHWQPRATLLADLMQPGLASHPIYLHLSYGLAAQTDVPWAARIWEPQAPRQRQAIEQIILSHDAITCLQDALDLIEATLMTSTSYVLVQ